MELLVKRVKASASALHILCKFRLMIELEDYVSQYGIASVILKVKFLVQATCDKAKSNVCFW